MKSFIKFFLLFTFCVGDFVIEIKSQNLVVNPSFELTSSNCSSFGGEGFTTDLLNWDDANSGADSFSSPDLFSQCRVLLSQHKSI